MSYSFTLHESFWGRKRLPVVIQTEAAECGLACLCMVAAYWGHSVDISSLRQRFSVSSRGATLKGLMVIASGMAFTGRPLKLEVGHLRQLSLPALLHWDMNHFVVLKSVSDSHAVIHDPSVGARRLTLTELSKHFTGVALELTPTSDFHRKDEARTTSLMGLMGKVNGLRGSLCLLLLLGMALQVCALLTPFYMQWLIDEAILTSDRYLVAVLGVGFLLLALMQTTIGAVRSWATTTIAANLNFQWLGNVFSHLMRLPLDYFEKRHTGDIVSRFSSIQTIQHSLTTQFVEGVIDGLLVLATVGMMFLYSPKLTVIALLAVIIYLGIRLTMFRSLREATAEQIIHAAKQQTHFLESVRGVRSLRLFNRNDERRASWLNTLVDQFNAELRISRLSVTYQAANSLLFKSERVVVIWIGALLTLDNMLSVGMLFAFISYKDQFTDRMASLVDKAFELAMLRLHAARLADIVMTEPEEHSTVPEKDCDCVSASIEFIDVSFRYADSEPWVLHHFHLTIPAGQCIAITGVSGCGKTTAVKLLLGLLEATQGEIRVGGQQISQLGMSNYRSMLGTVMQDDTLFAGSIADNICFFCSSLNLDEIEKCAKLAAVHAEIMAMPMGYNTLIGDIGTGLSGGQKQRLLLARALYRQPKLLVLDEATSHLDVWNEKVVNDSIQALKLTRVIVAHRPETIAMADRVVVLQEGAVVQDMTQQVSDAVTV